MADSLRDRLLNPIGDEWTTKAVREEASDMIGALEAQIVAIHNAFHDVHDLLYTVTRHNKQCRSCGFYGGFSHMGGCPVAHIEGLISGD